MVVLLVITCGEAAFVVVVQIVVLWWSGPQVGGGR